RERADRDRRALFRMHGRRGLELRRRAGLFIENSEQTVIEKVRRGMADVTIEGTCDARFARVREAFADNFVSRRETGASAALALDGRIVVDLWAGWADKARTRPWARDTIV